MTRKVFVLPYDSTSAILASPLEVDFLTSLKFLTSWMRLIGIPLGVKDVRSSFWRVLLSCYSIAILNLNLVIHFTSLTLLFHRDGSAPADNKVLNWNSAIAGSTFSLNIIGHNITSLVFTAARWESLVAAFNRLHKTCIFQAADYQKFKKKCFLGLSIIILLTVGLALLAAILLTTQCSAPLLQRILQAFKYVGLVQLYSFAVLLYILISAATSTLSAIEETITEYVERERESPAEKWVLILDKLKTEFSTVCELVEQINRCLGAPLLVTISCEFIRVVNSSFELLENARELMSFAMDQTSTLGFLTSEILFLVIITYTSHQVKAKAGKLVQEVWKLKIRDPATRHLHHAVISEMNLFKPKVEAMGFMEINLNILPKMLGTTLTYLIILWQLQTSEKR